MANRCLWMSSDDADVIICCCMARCMMTHVRVGYEQNKINGKGKRQKAIVKVKGKRQRQDKANHQASLMFRLHPSSRGLAIILPVALSGERDKKKNKTKLQEGQDKTETNKTRQRQTNYNQRQGKTEIQIPRQRHRHRQR